MAHESPDTGPGTSIGLGLFPGGASTKFPGGVAGSGRRPQRTGAKAPPAPPTDPFRAPRTPEDRSGPPNQNVLPSTKLFKLPNGAWITVANMADSYKALRAKGYNGRWFPPVSGGLKQFLQSDRYLNLYREISMWYATLGAETQEAPPDEIDLFGLISDALGGGFGSGAAGPVYQAPDEAAVTEALQGFQVAVTGELDEGLLGSAVTTYMKTHRQDFDDKNTQHDPFQAAKEIIRGSAAYKDIHELRPESDNELQWVTQQQGRLRTLGLTSEQAESLGIRLARVGASAESAQSAGEKAFFRNTGRVAKDQRDGLKSSARQVLSLL